MDAGNQIGELELVKHRGHPGFGVGQRGGIHLGDKVRMFFWCASND